jgi:hypothetical protein
MIDAAWKQWYRAAHDARCRTTGVAFEEYATALLKRLHPDFINPNAMGRRGDGGCDGLADNGSILYACYGSNAVTGIDSKIRKKLEADLTRALDCWPSFTTWRFVTNAQFGPSTVAHLLALRQAHGNQSARPLSLEVWRAPEDLWWYAADKLTSDQLAEVMPGVPHSQVIDLEDLVSVIENLGTVERDSVERLGEIRPVPVTKMDYNAIPEVTRLEFNEGRMQAQRINQWFARQPDPGLRDIKAATFNQVYARALMATSDPGELVEAIYVALGGSDLRFSTKRANAIYAVTAYFFDSCDIFEEPPTCEGGPDAAAD